MSIGTGIFLSAVFLGLVFLYNYTKDRWDWKKIAIRACIYPLILAILIGGIGYSIYWLVEEMPRPVQSFKDISLRDSPSDVRFKTGIPHWPEPEDSNLWQCSTRYEKIRIKFIGNKIHFIESDVDDGYVRYSSRAMWFKNSELSDILGKLGKPSSISHSVDELCRIYCFSKYNCFFVLKRGRVINYGIYNPELGEVRDTKLYEPKFRLNVSKLRKKPKDK